MFVKPRSAFKHEPQGGDLSLLRSLRSGIDYKQEAPLALECTERQRQVSDRRKDSRICKQPSSESARGP